MTDLVEGFEACLMQTTLQHRGLAADVGRLDAYLRAIERETLRVVSKPGISEADQDEVRRLADAAIARARKLGRVAAYSPAGA